MWLKFIKYLMSGGGGGRGRKKCGCKKVSVHIEKRRWLHNCHRSWQHQLPNTVYMSNTQKCKPFKRLGPWGGGVPHSCNAIFPYKKSAQESVAQHAMITLPNPHNGQGITVLVHITSFKLWPEEQDKAIYKRASLCTALSYACWTFQCFQHAHRFQGSV